MKINELKGAEEQLLRRLREDNPKSRSPQSIKIVCEHVLKQPQVVKYVGGDEDFYMLQSSQKDKSYGVIETATGWQCDCPSYKFQTGTIQGVCKHIQAVKFLIAHFYSIEEIQLTS